MPDGMSNKATIATLYAAMDRGDGDAMAALYAPDATFRDPAFGELSGDEAGDMWRMLTSSATDLDVELAEHDVSGDGTGTAHWIATYTFTRTGRKVRNDIRATFRFGPDGRIAEHVDRFSFHAWSRQALGPVGLLLGWTPILRRATNKSARGQLARFRASASAG